DLNWALSTEKSIERLIKQIDDICKKHESKLIIFVDAIDEWALDSSSIVLSQFVNHIKDKDVKLILSCKNSKIDEFLSIKGIPSVLSQNLFTTNTEKHEKNFNISDFSFKELIEAAKKYSEYFSLSGFITTSETFTACKDPFLLRVISEVYHGKEVPSTLSSIHIYEKYLDMIYSKNTDNQVALRKILTNISKKMMEIKDDNINENDLQGIQVDAFNFLVDYGILRNQKDNTGIYKISFIFDGLRNYLIAFYVLQLHDQSISNFEKFVDENIETRLGKELIRWYKEIAKDEQLPIIKQKIELDNKKLASEFLSKFTEKVENEFPFIRKRLFPTKKLGLLVLYDEKIDRIFEYGFRGYDDANESVIWLNYSAWSGDSKKTFSIMQQYNVLRLTASSRDFSNSPLDDFVYHEILSITKEIIKKRLLDESNNIGISLEKFFASLRHWGSLFGLPDFTYDTETEILPINTKELLQRINQTSFRKELDYIFEAATNNLAVLFESLSNLDSKFDQITSTVLPHCDDPNFPSRYVKPSAEYFTKSGLLNYVKSFFQTFIEEYKNLVEKNFPTLKEQFSTYQKYPVYVIARLHKSDRSEKADGLMYAICHNDGNDNEFEIRDYDDEKVEVTYDETHPGFCIHTRKGPKYVISYTSGMDMFGLFSPHERYFNNCSLTAFIYEIIESDLQELFGSKFRDIYVH
ncbi:MAG: hypothetical protein IIA83_06435, partial [Thaumarchaeota archaeon]|nr:hypothetical protein [Nitrososphaerota archaeon]